MQVIKHQGRSPIDRIFEDLTNGAFFGCAPARSAESDWVPALDVSETDKDVRIRVEVPGIDPEKLDITISDGVLSISGSKEAVSEEEGENFHRIERRYGSFVRRVSLPKDVDQDKVDASVTHGVLHLTIGKSEAATPKKITVKASNA